MRKELWYLRHADNLLTAEHTWQPESRLSDRGRSDIRRVRETHLVGHSFAAHCTSPFRRARETAAIAVPEATWESLEYLRPRLPEVWDALLASYHGPFPLKLEEIERLWPGFLDAEREWVMRSVPRALDAIKDGQKAILVSHQPLIGLVRGTLDVAHDLYDQSLGKGEIYRLIFSGADSALSEHLRVPA